MVNCLLEYDLKGTSVFHSNGCLGCLVPAHQESELFYVHVADFLKEKMFCGLQTENITETLRII